MSISEHDLDIHFIEFSSTSRLTKLFDLLIPVSVFFVAAVHIGGVYGEGYHRLVVFDFVLGVETGVVKGEALLNLNVPL
jgi:hypothetical protein